MSEVRVGQRRRPRDLNRVGRGAAVDQGRSGERRVGRKAERVGAGRPFEIGGRGDARGAGTRRSTQTSWTPRFTLTWSRSRKPNSD
jgi:hypothetical protein